MLLFSYHINLSEHIFNFQLQIQLKFDLGRSTKLSHVVQIL